MKTAEVKKSSTKTHTDTSHNIGWMTAAIIGEIKRTSELERKIEKALDGKKLIIVQNTK